MGELREAAHEIDEAVKNQNAAAAVSAATAKVRAVADRLEAAGLQDMKSLRERVENAFTYHAPKPDQVPRYNGIREAGKGLALLIVGACPNSPEKSTALAKLSETVMCANAAIARNE